MAIVGRSTHAAARRAWSTVAAAAGFRAAELGLVAAADRRDQRLG